MVPLGYEVREQKLIVNEEEAVTVRLIFSRYLELGSLPALQRDLRERGIVTRERKLSTGRIVGGRALTNGPLNYLLRNRMYLGEINHRGQSYLGEHDPILDAGLFDAVQAKLSENRRGLRLRHQASKALLLGKLFDDRGNSMTPSYAIKKGVRYRYYVSSVLAQGRKEEAGSVKRVAAHTIEEIVVNAIRDRKLTFDDLAKSSAASAPNSLRATTGKRQKLANKHELSNDDPVTAAIGAFVDRITLGAQSIEVRFARDGDQAPERLTIPWTPFANGR